MIQWIAQIDSTGYSLTITLPGDCIDDCSAQGAVDDSVAYWVERLGFDPPVIGTRAYLESTGGWCEEQLNDSEQNKNRLLWIICNDLYDEYYGRHK